MRFLKNTTTALTVGLALLAAGTAQAEENVPDDILDYDTALRCAALHGNFALANEDDKETQKFHDDLATRWTIMALFREEKKEDVLADDLASLILKLDERLQGMGDDEAAMQAFLEKAADSCGQLQEYFSDEFNAIPLEDEEE